MSINIFTSVYKDFCTADKYKEYVKCSRNTINFVSQKLGNVCVPRY